MNVFSIIRPVVSTLSGLGVGLIVGNAINATTPANIGRVSKVLIGFGAFGLGGLAAKVVAEELEREIVEVEKLVDSLRNLPKTDEVNPDIEGEVSE